MERETENLFKDIMAKNISNMRRKKPPQISDLGKPLNYKKKSKKKKKKPQKKKN